MKKKKTKLFLLLILILIFSYLIINLNIFNRNNLMEFFHMIEGEENIGIYFTIIVSILMVFFVPISWFSALAGALFGMKGIFYIVAAGLMAAVISFTISKVFRKDVRKIVEKIYGRKDRELGLHEVSQAIEEKGLSYIFLLRNLPFIPFSIANYTAGLTSISFRNYILGTFLGLVPGQLINIYFFHKAVNIRKNPLKLLLAAAIKVLYLMAILWWQRKSKYKAKD